MQPSDDETTANSQNAPHAECEQNKQKKKKEKEGGDLILRPRPSHVTRRRRRRRRSRPMLAGKKRPSSFGPDGRRILSPPGGAAPAPCGVGLGVGGAGRARQLRPMGRAALAAGASASSSSNASSTKASFTDPLSTNPLSTNPSHECRPGSRGSRGPGGMSRPPPKLVIRRAPVMAGLSVAPSLCRGFRRPMLGRRAYGGQADEALQRSSLGQRRRADGMSRILARAGRGMAYRLGGRPLPSLGGGEGSDSDGDSDDDGGRADLLAQLERNYRPLVVWRSPHNGGEAVGLPGRMVTEVRADENGIEETVTVRRPAPLDAYSAEDQIVPKVLAKWLRPHQREGVRFMYECVMGMREFDGQGCILADDMGLGKTLQSVALIHTLLKTGISSRKGDVTCKRVIVVCPCSLVKNWDNEFVKWLGPGTVKTLALAESDRKTVEKNLDIFGKTKMFSVLIASYETMRAHVGRLLKYRDCCDLLVCDEAHRLKNKDNQTSRALFSLPCRRRVLLTGTPMQNDLQEFFAMVDFINPGVLGTQEGFRREYMFPILRGREPTASERERRRMGEAQNEMSGIVNEFILRRINTLNAEHLPPKLVQVVCCNLTGIQQNMYQHLVSSKDMQHVLDGKQVNCLSSIQMLMKLSNHPSLVAEDGPAAGVGGGGRRAAARRVSYAEEDRATAAPGADGMGRFLPIAPGSGGRNAPVHPEWSGKMFVLYRLMREMRKPGNGNDKIVIVSNYTQTLDLIGRMCRENTWGFCRLDGSIGMKKRQGMVDEFNDPSSNLVAFLLSSKAGGCGLNLIGGNRLVLFDPDWNPAVDKQAAARCWRDGQKKRCFTYRFLATGTVEEKIFQRQLSKEGLQSVVDDKEQVNALSTKDLRNLFKLRTGTPSDTHDKLKCERCAIIADDQEQLEQRVLPKKLAACHDLLNRMMAQEHASCFLTSLKPEDHGVLTEQYEKKVKQPMDLGSIKAKLEASVAAGNSYKSVSAFSKDVNRIFSNVMKCWEPGQEIADSARTLQAWWIEEWTNQVPILMTMKPDEDSGKENEVPVCEHGNQDDKLAVINNERGENFQEQLGMPEEEDMRSWSHHFSTDTVDDPIFRAAMRGYDNVSFVFGLEVTWGLIQEKQQMQEEREAVKELERLEELEKEAAAAARLEGESSGSENEAHSVQRKAISSPGADKPDAAQAKTPLPTSASHEKTTDDCNYAGSESEEDDEDWTFVRMYAPEEIMGSSPVLCDENDCSRRACALWKSSGGHNASTCLDCLNEEYGGWPKGHNGPPDNSHKCCFETWCSGTPPDDDDGDITHVEEDGTDSEEDEFSVADDSKEESDQDDEKSEVNNDEAVMKEEEVSPNSISPGEWACAECTLHNSNSRRKCIVCGARRSK